MKSDKRMPKSLFAVAAVSLVAFNLWAAWIWSASLSQVEEAQNQLAHCQRVAGEIQALQTAPQRVDDSSRTSASLAALVEGCAKKSNLPTDRIVHIHPGDPRRLGDSPYEEQSTDVEFRELTLRQLIEFALTVTGGNPGLHVSTLTVRVPPEAANAKSDKEMWNAQLVLTSHIYAPKIPPLSPQ